MTHGMHSSVVPNVTVIAINLGSLSSPAPIPAPLVPAPPSPIWMKVTTPNEFSSAWELSDLFLNQLGLYFHTHPAEFQTEEDKIVFALSYMKGGTARSDNGTDPQWP